ncbi:MAG TPA: phosphoribosylaminoimidazolesuccinocarboxamide synthase [Candidatus Omnitrophota bacterium]|nr:phosphoribosylaminoimidazolesuccinocarboxamide synthase [Candidatus Omnitrophota bacterium]HRZ14158.1 phosphoribosylaminoimidazolesuccinocarboxamide synthase [Candidatus Omnitrophota bacterium]
MSEEVLLETRFTDIKLFRRGKVRDVYDLGDTLLVVSTDRISCFDVVLPSGIPSKGKVLTAMSCFWFDLLAGVVPNHFITADVKEFPAAAKKYKDQLSGRSMLVKKTRPLPVECVVRGYLSGSGWKEYRASQSVCGIALPAGLTESARLPEVLFTPSTKEEKGHDINVNQSYVEKTVGKKTADFLRQTSIALYSTARDYALTHGIIIADTKFEFGEKDGAIILIDEVLTPDSSRFWPAAQYAPGKGQPSFDKQFVRDYLEGLDWNKTPPAPSLPQDIIRKTTLKYLEAYRQLTGKELSDR